MGSEHKKNEEGTGAQSDTPGGSENNILEPSRFLKGLADEFREEGVLTLMAAKRLAHHGSQLCDLNKAIFEQCKKEGIDIETLKLNG